MNRIHPADLIAILSRIAGLTAIATDMTFQKSLTTLAGPNATTILAVLGLVGIIATDIIRVTTVPTQNGTPNA